MLHMMLESKVKIESAGNQEESMEREAARIQDTSFELGKVK